jgi:hypothetical protein
MTARRALAAVALLALGGCTGTSSGTPVPAANTAAATSTPVPVSRPKSIDLHGKQRCLLSPTDWVAFFIEQEGQLKDRDVAPVGRECFYDTNVGYFGFLFATTGGVEYWTRAASSDQVKPVEPVLGFPAFERSGSADKGRCDVIVDVADGQALDVFASIDDRSAAKLPPKCATARRLAELAVDSLSR